MEHTLEAPKGLIQVDRLLEIGPGIRPQQWYDPKEYRSLEPYDEYRKVLHAAGVPTQMGGADSLVQLEPGYWEGIYALDVIEHMSKYEGMQLIYHMERLKPIQAIIFTPLGFMPQEEDNWGYGGHEFQRHRSGWYPHEFNEKWTTQKYGKGFFAILTNDG